MWEIIGGALLCMRFVRDKRPHEAGHPENEKVAKNGALEVDPKVTKKAARQQLKRSSPLLLSRFLVTFFNSVHSKDKWIYKGCL